jgi:hypothetical protein
MWTVDSEIEVALNKLCLPEEELRRCSKEESLRVQEEAKRRFVENNPRAWWLALKQPFKEFPYHDANAYQYLNEYIPSGEDKFWFIPENEQEILPVFEATLKGVKSLLEECCFFEYYLVGKSFDWLIAENDHNELIISQIPKL